VYLLCKLDLYFFVLNFAINPFSILVFILFMTKQNNNDINVFYFYYNASTCIYHTFTLKCKIFLKQPLKKMYFVSHFYRSLFYVH